MLATCRDPHGPKSVGLRDLQVEHGGEGQNGRVKILQLDAADEKSIAQFGRPEIEENLTEADRRSQKSLFTLAT